MHAGAEHEHEPRREPHEEPHEEHKTVKCDCGSEKVEYITDADHDGGACAIYQCLECGKRFHVELSD